MSKNVEWPAAFLGGDTRRHAAEDMLNVALTLGDPGEGAHAMAQRLSPGGELEEALHACALARYSPRTPVGILRAALLTEEALSHPVWARLPPEGHRLRCARRRALYSLRADTAARAQLFTCEGSAGHVTTRCLVDLLELCDALGRVGSPRTSMRMEATRALWASHAEGIVEALRGPPVDHSRQTVRAASDVRAWAGAALSAWMDPECLRENCAIDRLVDATREYLGSTESQPIVGVADDALLEVVGALQSKGAYALQFPGIGSFLSRRSLRRAAESAQSGCWDTTVMHELIHQSQPHAGPTPSSVAQEQAEHALCEAATENLARTLSQRAARGWKPDPHRELCYEPLVHVLEYLCHGDDAQRWSIAMCPIGERLQWLAEHLGNSHPSAAEREQLAHLVHAVAQGEEAREALLTAA